MYIVTIISTEHRENGKCNSDELLKIIEILNPDVIFEEEADDDRYLSYYNKEESFKSLEVQSIKKYLQNHPIPHIPVDIELTQPFEEWDFMNNTFNRYDVYRNIVREHCLLRDEQGFRYLNSKQCVAVFNKMRATERQIIEFSGMVRSQLIKVYDRFHTEHDNRENSMIQKIHNYSISNHFNSAVFLLGYAHRESMMRKIKNYRHLEGPKLTWAFYNDTFD